MRALVQTIRFKTIAAMGTCTALILCIGVFGIASVYELNQNVKHSYTETTLPILDLENVRAAALDVRVRLALVQTLGDADTVRTADAQINADLAAIDKAWSDYYPAHVSAADERAVADKIKDDLAQLKTVLQQTLQLASANDIDALAKKINGDAAFYAAMQDLIDKDVEITRQEAEQFAVDSASTAQSTTAIAIGLVIAGALAAVGASVYLLRCILRPLTRAIDAAKQIANGKLGSDIPDDLGGEFGDLLRELSIMDKQISHTVRGIQSSAESVSVASGEIATGNTDLSVRTEEQAASLEETAASMTQITETVRQNADSARHANELSSEATGLANSGDVAVQEMVGTIEKISGSSSKISDITGVIEGIAFQTNILALNAAVEAARAGEQGRGFAVVASEVRNLAQRSASAAKEIKELIGSSVSIIQDGSMQAVAVSTTISQVKQAIKRVSDVVGEIAIASAEQSLGIVQVNQAVSQMDEITQQNAALVEQAAAAAQSLEEQAGNLKQAVSVFHFSDDA